MRWWYMCRLGENKIWIQIVKCDGKHSADVGTLRQIFRRIGLQRAVDWIQLTQGRVQKIFKRGNEKTGLQKKQEICFQSGEPSK